MLSSLPHHRTYSKYFNKHIFAEIIIISARGQKKKKKLKVQFCPNSDIKTFIKLQNRLSDQAQISDYYRAQ